MYAQIRLGVIGCSLCLTAMSRLQAQSDFQPAPKAEHHPKTKTYFLYCPKCGLEMAWHSLERPDERFCPRCGNGSTERMHVSEYSRKADSPDAEPTPMAPPIYLVAGTAGLALLWLALVQIKKRRLNGKTEEELHCRCPACGRRFRFGLAQAGQGTTCTVCKAKFQYPAAEFALKEEKSKKVSIPASLEALRKRPPKPTQS